MIGRDGRGRTRSRRPSARDGAGDRRGRQPEPAGARAPPRPLREALRRRRDPLPGGNAGARGLPPADGRVRLLKHVAMAERSLAVVKPGDLFGEGAMLEGTTYGSTAVAMTHGTVLALDRATFRLLLESHPPVATRAVDQLVRRLR